MAHFREAQPLVGSRLPRGAPRCPGSGFVIGRDWTADPQGLPLSFLTSLRTASVTGLDARHLLEMSVCRGLLFLAIAQTAIASIGYARAEPCCPVVRRC